MYKGLFRSKPLLYWGLLTLFGCTPNESLVLYTYRGLGSENGALWPIVREFEQHYGIQVQIKLFGLGTYDLLTRLGRLSQPSGDLVVGIDNYFYFLVENHLQPLDKESVFFQTIDALPLKAFTHFHDAVIPYDYSFLTFLKKTPDASSSGPWLQGGAVSLEPLITFPQHLMQEKIPLFLANPLQSEVGLQLFLWIKEQYPDNHQRIYRNLVASPYTKLLSSWDLAYQLYHNSSQAWVLTYGSSWLYHQSRGQGKEHKLLPFQAHPLFIEGVGILRSSKKEEQAQQFIQFLLEESSQKTLLQKNWMFPVLDSFPLQEEYRTFFEETPLMELRERWMSQQELGGEYPASVAPSWEDYLRSSQQQLLQGNWH